MLLPGRPGGHRPPVRSPRPGGGGFPPEAVRAGPAASQAARRTARSSGAFEEPARRGVRVDGQRTGRPAPDTARLLPEDVRLRVRVRGEGDGLARRYLDRA